MPPVPVPDTRELEPGADGGSDPELGPRDITPSPQRVLDDGAGYVGKCAAPAERFQAREHLDVEHPARLERLREDLSERLRISKHLCAALRVIHDQIKDDARGRGEGPTQVVAPVRTLDIAAEQSNPRAENDLQLGFFEQQLPHGVELFERSREVGIEVSDERWLELERTQHAAPNGFAFARVPLQRQDIDARAALR